MIRCTIEVCCSRFCLPACRQPQIIILALVLMLLTIVYSTAQPAKGANKFLGNITTMGKIRADFNEYWNHITAENESQWPSIEMQRNTMVWTGFDQIATYAREKKIPWRFHSLLTSGSYPGWMTSLSDTTLLNEIGQWMDLAAARYPDVTMIDVINEGSQNYLPGIFKRALGGNGDSGFDWAIKAFKMARERWPKALLIYNDFNNIEVESQITWTIDLINALKQAHAPIDIIGCEANFTQNLSTSKLKENIDRIAQTGLPVYISNYEVGKSSDVLQDSIIREQFTMFWNHPKIIGITYWGYIVGQTWRDGTGLLTKEGVERSALTWLKDFVKNNPNPPNDFPNLLNLTTGVNCPDNAEYMHIRITGRDGYGVFDLLGRSAVRYIDNSGMNCTQGTQMSNGLYMLHPVEKIKNAANVRVIKLK